MQIDWYYVMLGATLIISLYNVGLFDLIKVLFWLPKTKPNVIVNNRHDYYYQQIWFEKMFLYYPNRKAFYDIEIINGQVWVVDATTIYINNFSLHKEVRRSLLPDKVQKSYRRFIDKKFEEEIFND